MLHIDGSFGEGGGQILRSSLTLSLVTGRPFVIEKIRSARKKPGLARQHLTAVEAAAAVSHAEVEGDELGSTRVVFQPGTLEPGHYEFQVGTAGSTILVFQTVLPAMLGLRWNSSFVIEGGTHNPMAPPFDFFEKTYVPLVNSMGPYISVKLERPGYYPSGGGRITATVEPAETLGHLQLTAAPDVRQPRVRSLVSHLPRNIAERECRAIAKKTGWDPDCFTIEEITKSRNPINLILIELPSQRVTEVFTGFGQPGVKSEVVAKGVLKEAKAYLAAGVPVGPHLADQLMLPMAIAAHRKTGGGVFRTNQLTDHATTHIEVIQKFLEIDVQVKRKSRHDWMVRIE